MHSAPVMSRVLVALALLTALAGCPGPGPNTAPGLDKAQLFDAYRQGPDTIRRTLECVQKNSDGECIANKCTASPKGDVYNCNSYAKACLDGGFHWNGTNDQGVCSVPL